MIDIVDWDGGLAVAGASDKSGNQHPYVALSGDGRAWTQTMLSAEEEGYASAMAVAGETLVSAGVDADRLTLWTLAGDAWQPETIEPEGAAINAMAWTPDLGLVGVGSSAGQPRALAARGELGAADKPSCRSGLVGAGEVRRPESGPIGGDGRGAVRRP